MDFKLELTAVSLKFFKNNNLKVSTSFFTGMNFLLPFLMIDKLSSSSGSSLTDSLVLMMILSQQQMGIQTLG